MIRFKRFLSQAFPPQVQFCFAKNNNRKLFQIALSLLRRFVARRTALFTLDITHTHKYARVSRWSRRCSAARKVIGDFELYLANRMQILITCCCKGKSSTHSDGSVSEEKDPEVHAEEEPMLSHFYMSPPSVLWQRIAYPARDFRLSDVKRKDKNLQLAIGNRRRWKRKLGTFWQASRESSMV